ncbi:hypothetical protein D3C81_1382580 [compost metagenome]
MRGKAGRRAAVRAGQRRGEQRMADAMSAPPLGQCVAVGGQAGTGHAGIKAGAYPPFRGQGGEACKFQAWHQRHRQASQHVVRRSAMGQQADPAPGLRQQLVQHQPPCPGHRHRQRLRGRQPGRQHGAIGTLARAYPQLRCEQLRRVVGTIRAARKRRVLRIGGIGRHGGQRKAPALSHAAGAGVMPIRHGCPEMKRVRYRWGIEGLLPWARHQ